MKIGIINSSQFYRSESGICYTASDELKSLSQWFPLFDEVILYRLEQKNASLAKDWMPLPKEIKCESIGMAGVGILKQMNRIAHVANHANQCDMFYYRLPNYESLVFWLNQNKEIPYFVELHGDIESAFMATSHPYLIRIIGSKVFKYLFTRMSSKAKFALSIGPALRDIYVKSDIPTYVTTNNLLKIEDYPPLCVKRDLPQIPQLLFVGHIHERKGLRYYFRALASLYKRGIHFKLMIAGKGDLQPWLEDYAKNEGFSDCVEFLGQVKHGPELFRLYKEADLFVLPSIAAEGVPRVTHESMAFCCPVIATDIGSVKWQLSGGAGMVIPPKNAKAIEDAIFKVITDNILRTSLIEKGYKKSVKYSIQEQAKGIQSFVSTQLKNL